MTDSTRRGLLGLLGGGGAAALLAPLPAQAETDDDTIDGGTP